MLRVLYHIGKDTKYIANKQECNRFFVRLPRGGGHSRREGGGLIEREDVYNKVWTKREDAPSRNIENITENKIITLYF